MVQKTRAELETELQAVENQLQKENTEIQKRTEAFKIMEEEKRNLEKQIADLDAPSNPFLKALSRIGSKANNVVRNVRFSVMNDEQLKEEYVIYQRVSESLGKPVVSFEEFKESPEDHVFKERKESILKKLETDFAEGLDKTVDGITKARTTIEEKTNELTDKALPEIEKIKGKVAATIEDSKTNPDSTAQKLKGTILNTVDEAKPILSELGRTFKLGASLLKTKIEKAAENYAQAKAEVETAQESAQKTGSTPPKTEAAKQAVKASVDDEKQAKVVGTTDTTVEKATPNTKQQNLSRRDQFLVYMDTVVDNNGTDIKGKANYQEYVMLAGEDAYKEPNFKRFVKEFETAFSSELAPSQTSEVAETVKPARKRSPKKS